MSKRDWRKQREDRVRRVNALVVVISTVGRKFFRQERNSAGTVSQMEMDARGRLWWRDKWTNHRLYLHCRRPLGYRFSEGGTLRCLVLAFKGYVMTGEPIHPARLGPWPNWCCGGDLWGYGDAMETVRQTALALGIIKGEHSEATNQSGSLG